MKTQNIVKYLGVALIIGITIFNIVVNGIPQN